MGSFYQNYGDLLQRSKNEESMSDMEKTQLKKDLESLEAMDHVEVIKIIDECMPKKVYTVNNRQTMVDLEDLNNKCLWRINYYVNFCLENQKREKEKQNAEKQHLDKLHELEENIKRKSKLKLTGVTVPERSDGDEGESEIPMDGSIEDNEEISE